MAVVATLSNHFKFKLMYGDVSFYNDSFKIILMNTTFTFNKDTHATLSDVSSDELSTGYGYTQQNKACTVSTITEDDTNDRCRVEFDDVSWTASGGSIGPSGAAIIYDDTTSDDTVVGCIDFGTDETATDTQNFDINDIILDAS